MTVVEETTSPPRHLATSPVNWQCCLYSRTRTILKDLAYFRKFHSINLKGSTAPPFSWYCRFRPCPTPSAIPIVKGSLYGVASMFVNGKHFTMIPLGSYPTRDKCREIQCCCWRDAPKNSQLRIRSWFRVVSSHPAWAKFAAGEVRTLLDHTEAGADAWEGRDKEP